MASTASNLAETQGLTATVSDFFAQAFNGEKSHIIARETKRLASTPAGVIASGTEYKFILPKGKDIDMSSLVILGNGLVCTGAVNVPYLPNFYANVIDRLRLEVDGQIVIDLQHYGLCKTMQMWKSCRQANIQAATSLGIDTNANRLAAQAAGNTYLIPLVFDALEYFPRETLMSGHEVAFIITTAAPTAIMEAAGACANPDYTFTSMELYYDGITLDPSFIGELRSRAASGSMVLHTTCWDYFQNTVTGGDVTDTFVLTPRRLSLREIWSGMTPSATLATVTTLLRTEDFELNALSSYQWNVNGTLIPQAAVRTGATTINEGYFHNMKNSHVQRLWFDWDETVDTDITPALFATNKCLLVESLSTEYDERDQLICGTNTSANGSSVSVTLNFTAVAAATCVFRSFARYDMFIQVQADGQFILIR